MKKIIIISCAIFLTGSQFIFGQQSVNRNDEEAFLKQIQSSALSLPFQNSLEFSNRSQIQQMGNSNNASINQIIEGINGSGNIAELIQNGDLNNAVITQSGNGNNHFINQTGNRNMFDASIIGDNNSSTIDQFGNDNIINQNVLGNDMAFILSQLGNNNEIVQIKNDQQTLQYQIYQRGNGMKITIINSGIFP